MHQRERGHLPALRTTPWTPNFSKSAPNLDKSRSGANSMPTSTTSRNILGKSHEGLNSIKSKKYNKSLDADDEREHYDGYEYDDDDDDGSSEIKGCFGWKKEKDDSPSSTSNSTNRNFNNNHLEKGSKKLSLDSQRKYKEANVSLSKFESSHENDDDDDEETIRKKYLDDVPYDRIFYRGIQKSLDEIFARDDYNQQFVDNSSHNDTSQYLRQNRNSKSSNDLSYFNVGGVSKFKRECFFTNHSQSLDLDNGNDDDNYSSSTHSNSSRQLEDSFSSLKIREPKAVLKRESKNFDERSNSFCSSDDASTPSRKSSVTFKSNPIDSTNYSVDSSFSILSTPSSDTSLSQISNILTLQNHDAGRSVPRKFTLNQNYHDLLSSTEMATAAGPPYRKEQHPKLRDKIDKPKSKTKYFKNIFKDFKNKNKKLVTHSNSIYRKINDREMNEKLLDNSNVNQIHIQEANIDGSARPITISSNSSSVRTEESQYDTVFCTRNFVLGRQNNNV